MEYGNPRAKIVGFIAIILILVLLTFFAFKLAINNKNETLEKNKIITYQEKNINLSLNGDYVEYIKKNKPYVEKGVKAFTKDGIDLSNTVVVSYFTDDKQVARVNTSNLDSYWVKYTIINPKTNKYLAIYRTIIVTKK